MTLKLFMPKLWFRKDLLIRARRYVRAILYTFNLQTLILATIACTAVFLCGRWSFRYTMDFSMVATGTTFPLIFTIQQAFTRRERACSLIAELKASIVATYLMHRDWAQDEGYPATLGSNHTSSAVKAKVLLVELLHDMRNFLTAHSAYESYAERRLTRAGFSEANWLLDQDEAEGVTLLAGAGQSSAAVDAALAAKVAAARREEPASMWLRKCYRAISQLSVMNEQLTLKAGYTRGGEGGMSRTHQYLRYITASLEELRMLRDYRTPIMMRYANGVLLHVFAVMLAPYFLHYCDDWTDDGFSAGSCPAGYSACLVYVVIVMLLYHIAHDMEVPFDESGLDDVFFDIGEELLDEVFEVQGTTQACTPCMTSRSASIEKRTTRSLPSLLVTRDLPATKPSTPSTPGVHGPASPASKASGASGVPGAPGGTSPEAVEWLLKAHPASPNVKPGSPVARAQGFGDRAQGFGDRAQGFGDRAQVELVQSQHQQQELPARSRLEHCSSTDTLLQLQGRSEGDGE